MSKSELQILPDAVKNKTIESYVDHILRLRVSSASDKIEPRDIKFATRDVNKPSLSFNALVTLCVTKLNVSNDKVGHRKVLLGHIAHLAIRSQNPNKYNPVDHQLAVTFACAALNDSSLKLEARKDALEQIKNEYPDYDPKSLSFSHLKIMPNMKLSERIYHYYHLKPNLKVRWKAGQNLLLPIELREKILGQNIPIGYLIATVPADELEKVLRLLGIDLQLQFKALEEMMANAAAGGISKEDGIKYFKLQYGESLDEQLIAFIREFGKTPVEVQKDNKVKKAFVTQAFIDVWEEIESLDPARRTTLNFFAKGLYRFPRNIGPFTSLAYLTLSGNQLTSLPPEVWNLDALIYLGLTYNQFTSLPLEIGELTALTKLRLDHNPLKLLPAGIFKRLEKLDDLTVPSSVLKADIRHAGIRKEIKYFKIVEPEDFY